MSEDAPRVFISYSHDTPEHKAWVARLGTRLLENGVNVILDQWDLFPGDDVPTFMEQNLSTCDFAVLVCTKKYVSKANQGQGGVGYEKMIVTSELVRDIEISKFIPIIRQVGTREVPTFLSTRLFIDFSGDDDFEVVFDDLLRTVFRSALAAKPPIGQAPSFEEGRVRGPQTNPNLPPDVLTIFRRIGDEFDRGAQTWWNPETLLKLGIAGRLAGEEALQLLEARGLLERDRDGDFILSPEGKSVLRQGV